MPSLSAAVTGWVTGESADVFSSLQTAAITAAPGRADAATVECGVVERLRQGADAVTSDTCEMLLRRVLVEVLALRADWETFRAGAKIPGSLTPDDRVLLAKILPAAGGVFGSTKFLTRDLFESDSAALRLVLRGLNPKRVGKLFGRVAGEPIDGYAIERDGTELNAQLWRIVRH